MTDIQALLPPPESAIRSIEGSVITGLRILGHNNDEAQRAGVLLEKLSENVRQNLFNYAWSNLAEVIIRVAQDREAALKADEDDDEDDEVEPVLRPMTAALSVTVELDDDAALALSALVASLAQTNAEVITHALKFYIAALRHHQEQLDELNDNEGGGWGNAQEA